MKKIIFAFLFLGSLLLFEARAQFPASIKVESNGQISESPTTVLGKKYRITVEGTYTMWPQYKDCHGVDAVYVYDVPQEEIDAKRWLPEKIQIGPIEIELIKLPHWVGDPTEWKIPPEQIATPVVKLSFRKYLGFRVDNEPMPNSGFQAVTHRYSIEKIGTGQPFSFQILDSNYNIIQERVVPRYDDNCGQLTVVVEEISEDSDIEVTLDLGEFHKYDESDIGISIKVGILEKDSTSTTGKKNRLKELDLSEVVIIDNGRIICDIDSIVCDTRTKPLAIGLLIDNTESMQGPISEEDNTQRMKASKESISKFLDAIIEQDEVFVMSFNETTELVQDWTNDKDLLKEKINSLIPDKKTSLFKAIVDGLEKLSTHSNPNRTLIVLSDGGNTFPPFWEESNVRKVVFEKNIPVYAIALGFTDLDIDKDGFEKLDIITKSSPGGKLFSVYNSNALDSVYKKLSVDLTTEEDCYIYFKTDSCEPGTIRWIRVIYAPDDSTIITKVLKFKCPEVSSVYYHEEYNEQIESLANIDVFPNPLKDLATVKYSIYAHGVVTISISDMLGKTVFSQKANHDIPGEYSYVINADNLSNGVYIATVIFNNEIISKKIVVLK